MQGSLPQNNDSVTASTFPILVTSFHDGVFTIRGGGLCSLIGRGDYWHYYEHTYKLYYDKSCCGTVTTAATLLTTIITALRTLVSTIKTGASCCSPF